MKKKVTKLFTGILAVLMILALLTACGAPAESVPAESDPVESTPVESESTPPATSEEEFNPADYPIGMVAILRTNPVIQSFAAGAISRAEELGYPVYFYAPDGSDGAQAYALADAGIAQQGLKGIVLHMFDESASQYATKWKEQGVLTVGGHASVSEEDRETYKDMLAWCACSAERYGREAANAIAAEIGEKGIVAVTCGSYTMNEAEAADAFIDEMKKYPDITVLEPQEEGFDTPIAIQRATSIIQANPELAGAFSTTGSGAVTWATAQKNAGKEICIIGMDYTEANLDLVSNGEVYALVAQPIYDEFRVAVDLLDAAFRGETVNFDNLVPAPLITLDNVQDYYAIIEKVNETMKNYL